MNLPQDEPMERLTFQTSCERCRTRKIKCDRVQPCANCDKGNHECAFRGNGEKQRPVSKAQMQALEAEIKSLRTFIGRLSKANSSERDEMLATFNAADPQTIQQTPAVELETPAINDHPLTIRPRAGHLRKLRDGKAAQFFGATSFFQINPSEDQEESFSATEVAIGDPSATIALGLNIADLDMDIYSQLAYALVPQSEICLRLMATFFMKQYHYHMCVYREYFLRDFDAGGGPYYSDLLMYAICAMGALASEDPNLRSLSEIFASRAQELLYGSACLCSPNLTTLQALLLLGHREIGRGKASKGWLFSGMAFRLAHEMGLHLDPSNWKGSRDSRIDREILRRVYWAAFIADKQLSLYFGRPPALYPGESDVRNTIRIPYPPEWAALLDKYIMKGTSETAYEDGVALVGTWIYQAELSKIQHRMITEVFENRNIKTDPTVLATSITQIHVSLTKWLADLPSKLHWTKWTVGPIPSNIIQLHLVYHTSLIILRRPPRHSLTPKNNTNTPPTSINQNKSPPPSSTDESDIETCYTSLSIIIRLLKLYARHYAYNQLPLTIVHTLASAASVLLMKRYLENLPWDNVEIAKPLELVLSAIDGVSETWPAARQVRQVLGSAVKERTSNGNDNENATGGRSSSDAQLENTAGLSPGSFDFMSAVGPGLMDDLAFDQMVDVNFCNLDATDFNVFDPTVLGDDFDLGQLMTDEFMNNELSWENTGFS